jgi:trehalose 6-phosphate phosphatase
MNSDVSSPVDEVPFEAHAYVLFLDFDGTLASIQDDPDTVGLPGNGAETLLALKQIMGGALVLISGRDIRDLSSRTPIELWRAGGHGLEICKPGAKPALQTASAPDDLIDQAEKIVMPMTGVRVEHKGPVLAIHFRQNPRMEQELLKQLSNLAQDIPGYKAQHGKMVIELKPERANKGKALAEMMTYPDLADRIPIMVGDDTTDEDAMRVATDLGGLGIKVGEGETCAQYRFSDTATVWNWLRRLVNEHT